MPHAIVRAIENLTPSLFLLKLEAESGLQFKAGQFICVAIPSESKEETAKPGKGYYSIASGEQDDLVELIVEHREGHLSAWMTGLKKGDTVSFDAPIGKFSLANPQARTQLFLGLKAGLAPLRSMILTLTKMAPSQHLHLFLGAYGSSELILDSQWRALAGRCDKFHYHPVVRPTAENPFFGKNQDPADELIKKMTRKEGNDIYLAGFNKEVEPMLAKLEAAGFEKAFIRVERFG
jgi:phenol hydroxylase P5 protein